MNKNQLFRLKSVIEEIEIANEQLADMIDLLNVTESANCSFAISISSIADFNLNN